MLIVTVGQENEAPLAYVGMKGCVCHKLKSLGNQVGHWKEKDPHAKAYESLQGEKSKKLCGEMGIADPLTDKRCAECHMTAFGVAAERLGSLTPEDGVTCESCHGPGERYSKKEIMNDRDAAVASGLILLQDSDQRKKVCGKCHNEKVPKEFSKTLDFVKDWEPYKHKLAPPEAE